MKKFRFTLATVERLRQQQQDQAEHALRTARQAWRRCQENLAAVQTEQRHWGQHLCHSLLQGMAAEEAQQNGVYLATLATAVEKCAVSVSRAGETVQRRRQDLERIARARQVVEKLRQRQYGEYQLAAARQEQALLDDVALRQYLRHAAADKRQGA